jgi:hypothetical protein
LRDALRELIESPQRRLTLAQAARARALQHTPQRLAADYLKAYAMLRPALGSPATRTLQCA